MHMNPFREKTCKIRKRCKTSNLLITQWSVLASEWWQQIKVLMTCSIWNDSYMNCGYIYEGDMWSSQWISNLSNWNEEAWKKSGLQRDSNPWPPRYRCDALPTELWSHTLGERSIVSSYFPVKGVKWRVVYEMIHIWTADIYMKVICDLFFFFQASSCQLLKLEIHCEDHISSSYIYPQFIYESFHILHVISLLSWENKNSQLTSLPMCGFIAQLVEHRTGIAEVTGSNPVEALIFFFRLLHSNCLNWKFTAKITYHL